MGAEIRHLRALVAVAETGSITKAAARLRMGQPQLSRLMSQLERTTGLALLERSPGGSVLTADGLLVVARAQQALHAFDLAVDADAQRRAVTIGYSWSILGRFTNSVFRSWEAQSEGRVNLQIKRFQDGSAGLITGTADLAIVRLDSPPSRNKILLFAERRLAALSVHHPLASRAGLCLGDFADETLVLNSVSGSTTLAIWSQRALRMRSPTLVESIDEWNHLVALDKGVGLTPESTRIMHPYPGIRYLPVSDAPPAPVWLIWDNAAFEDIARQFAAVVHRVVQERTVDEDHLSSHSAATSARLNR